MLPARNIPVPQNELIRRKMEIILNHQRMENIEMTNENPWSVREQLPIQVLKKFTVAIVYGPDAKY